MLAGIDAVKLAPVVICMVCPGCSAILLLKRMPSGSLLHLNKYFPSCQGSIKITVPWGLVAALLLLFFSFFAFCFSCLQELPHGQRGLRSHPGANKTGDGWASAKNTSNVRRLNMHFASSLAVLFSGEQWVSQGRDFQIKFILVMENVLIC